MAFLVTQLILISTIIGNVLLILFVFSQNIKPLINKVLVVQMLGILGWVCSIFINLWLANNFVEQLIFAFAAMALTAQLYFVFLFPESQPKEIFLKYFICFALGLGFSFILASFIPGAVFSSISVTDSGYTIVYPGWFSVPYATFVFVYIFSAIFLLAYKYQRIVNQNLKNQTKYLLYGFIIFFLTNLLTNSILPVIFNIHFFNGIGPLFSLILVAFIVHNIYRYKFLEIQSIIQRGLIYLFLSGLIISFYLIIISIIGTIAQPTLKITALTAGAITTLIGIFTVPHIDHYLRRTTHPFFFKGRFDYSETMLELSQVLHYTLNLKKIINETINKLETIFGASDVSIKLNNDKNHTETIENYELYFPLTTTNGKVGELLLGKKLSSDTYTKRDKQMLSTLANQVAIAMERAQLYEEVEVYSRELEQKVEERTIEIKNMQAYQRKLLDEIAHGLQTPITIISNELEVLKFKEDKHVASFKKSIDSLIQFINDLLCLSKLEAPTAEIELVKLNLSELLSEFVEYCAISLNQPNIIFSHQIAKNIFIKGNAKKLEEALLSLLSNAVKYRDESRVSKISLSVKQIDNHAVIQIQDNGIGMEQSHLPHIFKRFYRIRDKKCQTIEGSGLGLTIVNMIVLRHHGIITVESEKDRYTIFTIKIPLYLKE